MSGLKTLTLTEYLPKMAAAHKINVNEVPRLVKVVVNSSSRDFVENEAVLKQAIADLAKITGQIPAATKAKKSIAGFKIREGNVVGIKTTLRGKRMYDFVTRIINIALPRIRDFRGISESKFDKSGNLSFAFTEHTVFPEIEIDKVTRNLSFQITFVFSRNNVELAKEYLKQINFPLK